MSGFSLLAPIGLLGLIAIPIVVLLYMRTTTPTERRIPATRFWLTSQTSPSETRRFRLPPITPLFILHLLIAALIAFALARPASAQVLSRFGSRTEPTHVILVVDGSTSMLAYVDSGRLTGRTRFDVARQRVRQRLGDLRNGDVATVIVLGTRTTTFQASDEIDIGRLRDQLDELPLPGGRADLNFALRLCQDLLLPGMRDEIVIITDGAVTADPVIAGEIAAPITLELVTESGADNNTAITEILARGSSQQPGRQDLYLRIVNFSSQSTTANLVIEADEVVVAEREISLDPNASRAITQVLPAGAKRATATLQVADVQAADNTATISLAGAGSSGTRILLVSDQPSDLLRALNALPGSRVDILSLNQYLVGGPTDNLDLVVFEGAAPTGSYPDLPTLLVNPGDLYGQVQTMIAQPEPVRVLAQDPLLTGVDLAGVTFGQIPAYVLAPDDIEVVGAEGGPLIFRTQTSASQRALVLAFDVAESNLPLRVSFPILVSNLVTDLVRRNVPASLAVGDPLIMSIGASTASVRVFDPKLQSQDFAADQLVGTTQGRQLTYIDTGGAGLYQVQELDDVGAVVRTAEVSVNAGHPLESNLAANPLLEQSLVPSANSSSEHGIRQAVDIWPVILTAVLIFLLAEWILTLRQHRRTIPFAAGGGR